MNSLQRRARFDAVIEEFNGERPHQAPGLRCPAELYTPFTRPYRIWLVSFMHYDLGYIDLEQRTLQPTDNPFGPGVSPMS